MSFTETEKVNIRRYCGYDAFGSSSNPFYGARFFRQYGQLEFRMNNLTPEEEDVVRNTFLLNLSSLEIAIPSASSNLDTKQAAVWTWNPNELRDRENLYNSWRIKLCDFFGIPAGNGIRSLNSARIVV